MKTGITYHLFPTKNFSVRILSQGEDQVQGRQEEGREEGVFQH